MASAAASTDPLGVQVMRAVLGSRLPAAPDQRQAIEDALAVHDSICVRVAVGHSECEARCTRSAPVELWSVAVEEEEEGGPRGPPGPPLPAIFLLNAVRSYVHFSQLSAWLRPAEGGGVPPAAASYELLMGPAAAAAVASLLSPPCDASVADHAFPLAADAWPCGHPRVRGGRVVRVAVRYVQRERPPSPSGLCLQLGRLPTDEWLLASPLPSPTGREGSPLMEGGHAPFGHAHFETAAGERIIRGMKHKSSEPPLYSPTGPALKQAHFGMDEELVIEEARDEPIREDTVVEEEEKEAFVALVEEKREEHEEPNNVMLVDHKKKEDEEGERRMRRRAMLMMREKEKESVMKKERRGGMRRMIGGWEESVLRGSMEERPLPHAGYTLTMAASSAPPVRLRLATASLADSVASCVSRVTVAECARVRESVDGVRKAIIRRRGYPVLEAGQLQMSLLNAEGTPLCSNVLTMQYDVRDMPPDATTILRHRVRLAPKTAAVVNEKPQLRYLVQMSISRDRSGRCFVTGEITVVFTTDASVDGANLKMDTVTGVARAANLYELQAETVTAPFSLKANLVVV
ncbi:hypothetical protein PENTCL1PPCAC_23797 [Pristionchus entomophagus]|uniref:Uncharacterized protein n=1 Tax=Pristionchus entomophagus TaxID=358040 RepID=A0AAV5U4S0_9BILA|nr:hypothetical protein PENTCL1PPCAC_23797 [Pristionchus entomophagus]